MTRAGPAGGDGPPSGSLGAPSADPGTRPPLHRGLPPKSFAWVTVAITSSHHPLPRHITIRHASSQLSGGRIWVGRKVGSPGASGLVPWRVGSKSISALPPAGGGAANPVGFADGRGPDPCPGRRCRAGARSHNQGQACVVGEAQHSKARPRSMYGHSVRAAVRVLSVRGRGPELGSAGPAKARLVTSGLRRRLCRRVINVACCHLG